MRNYGDGVLTGSSKQFANISSTDAGARILNSIATDSDITSELIAAPVHLSTGKSAYRKPTAVHTKLHAWCSNGHAWGHSPPPPPPPPEDAYLSAKRYSPYSSLRSSITLMANRPEPIPCLFPQFVMQETICPVCDRSTNPVRCHANWYGGVLRPTRLAHCNWTF